MMDPTPLSRPRVARWGLPCNVDSKCGFGLTLVRPDAVPGRQEVQMPGMAQSTTPDQAAIRLRVFGSPEVRKGGEVLRLTARQLTLLTLLAERAPEKVETSILSSHLWASGADAALRKGVQKDVTAIRKALANPDAIVTSSGCYRLNLELVRTDFQDLAQALREGRVVEAAQLIEPGLLSSMRCDMTSALASWTLSAQMRLRDRVRTVAVRKWAAARDRADWSECEEAGRALLTVDAGSEGALRRVMKSVALQGRLEEAEAVFAAFAERARLKEQEKGQWQPAPATVRLLDRLPELARWRQELSLEAADFDGDTLPLVGREEEMQRIGALLRSPLDDGAQFIWITGEPGMGKTRLAHEAIAAFAPPAARVLSTRCTEAEQRLALAPLVSLIARGWVATEVAKLEEPWQDTIVAWVPELAATSLDAVPPDPDPGDTPAATRRTAHAFLELFRHLARSGPLILFIDDLDRADQATHSVLEYVVRRWEDGSLTIVGAGGEGAGNNYQIGPRTPLHPDLRVRLEGLSDEDISLLVEASELDPETLETTAVFSEEALEKHLRLLTSGRPGRLKTVLDAPRHSRDQGLSPPDQGIRQSVTKIVSDAAAGLSKECWEALAFCMCWGDPFALDELSAVIGWEASRAEAVVGELVRTGLVSCRKGRFEFSHPLIASVMEAELDTAEMPNLHSRMASALADKSDPDTTSRRARHLFLAGLSDEGTTAALELATQADREGRLAQALDILELAATHGSSDPRTQAEIGVRFAEGLLCLGHFDEAQKQFERSVTLSRKVPDSSLELRSRLGSLIAIAFESKFANTRLLEPLALLISQMQRTGLIEELPTAFGLRLRILSRNGDISGVRQTLSELQHLSAWANHPICAKLKLLRHVDVLYQGIEEDRNAYPTSGLAALAGSDSDLALDTLNWQVILGIMAGDLGLEQNWSVRREAAECLKAAARPFTRFKLQANIGVWYLETADIDGAEVALSQAEAIMGDLPMPPGRSHLMVNLGELQLKRRDYAMAKEAFSAALAESPSLPLEPARNLALAGLSLSHLGLGQVATARDYVEGLLPITTQYPFDHSLVIIAKARIAQVTESRRRALEILKEGSDQLCGRFHLGWANLEIERIRLGDLEVSSTEALEAFLNRNELGFLLSRFRVAMASD